jgi:hypothetical protein
MGKNFPVFSRGTGNMRAETGSLMTASTAEFSRDRQALKKRKPKELLGTVPLCAVGRISVPPPCFNERFASTSTRD